MPQSVTTTVYIGDYFELSVSSGVTSTVKYYYAGRSRIAMRQNEGAVKWLLGDHLGSASVAANADGSLSSRQGYKAWGETRFGSAPTKYQYTGQPIEQALGLYYYGARWYDPVLGRFVQPDTVLPDPNNTQDWDRYPYTRNNPLKYIDPDGHNPLLIIAIIGALIFFSQIPSDQYQSNPNNRGDPGVQVIGLALMLAPILFPASCLDDGNCVNEVDAVQKTTDDMIDGVAKVESKLNDLKSMTGQGKLYEEWIRKNFGGEGNYKLFDTQYDNKLGNVLMEGKSSSWAGFTPTSDEFMRFQNQIGREFSLAANNGYKYVLHLLNRPPKFIIDWLVNKGIDYVIDTER